MNNYRQSCLLLNKPSGISSNDVLTKVKKKINQKKAGFSGTLDPLASGLLIIFFNKATKLCSFFLNSSKSYEAVIKLGLTSSTGDLDGKIKTTNITPNLKNLNTIEKKYLGEVLQVPPMYSALKYKGVRLYEYARKGISIDRKPRKIVIHDLKLSALNDKELFLQVKCSKGTYIRTLAEQIGKDLGSGGTVTKLTRTSINDVSLDNSIELEKFLNSSEEEIFHKYMINVDQLLIDTKSYYLSDYDVPKILNGNSIKTEEKPLNIVKMYDKNNVFLGIGEINENYELLPRKILI